MGNHWGLVELNLKRGLPGDTAAGGRKRQARMSRLWTLLDVLHGLQIERCRCGCATMLCYGVVIEMDKLQAVIVYSV